MEGKFMGDVSPEQAWQGLQENPAAALLDVRTQPEWLFVGLPDLSSLGRQTVQASWQVFPTMARNPAFANEVQSKSLKTGDNPVYVICRSGARSRAAAEFLAERGYTTYNVADGFEGQIDGQGHRGQGGWRAAGLPWKQS